MELLSVTMNDGVMPRSEIEGKDNSSEDKSNYKVVLTGDMVYNSMRMWQGANGISPCDGIVSPAYTVLMPKIPISNGYFAAFFKSPNLINEFRKNSQGMTSDTWNLKYPQIETIKVCIPALSEQNRVADMLRTLERRIGKQAQLVDNLKKYKRGVTRAIFSKELSFSSEGSQYPQWDQKLIGEICKIQTGKSNTQDETDEGLYPFYVRSPVVRKSYRYLFNCEAVLTVGDGVGTGKVFHYVTGKFDLHQRVYAMTDFRKVSGKYFYYYFSHFFYDRVMRMTAKTSVDSVRYEMIDKMPILIPCEEEQNQIVFFLDRLGAQLKDAENELLLLATLKSGLLQQLFI
jgi:type I restriction enzyme S subunit